MCWGGCGVIFVGCVDLDGICDGAAVINRRLICLMPVWVALLLGVWGCNGVDSSKGVPEPIGRSAALAAYNANVVAVPAFKARIKAWEISYKEPEGGKRKTFKGSAGTVIFQPAGDHDSPMLYLQADPLIGSEALVVCVNRQEYWLSSGQSKQGWWGKLKHSGKVCGEAGILNLHILLGLVGFETIADEPLVPPYLMYKVGPENNTVYIADDVLRLRREVILGRRDNLLKEVRVYDEKGMYLICGRLGDYQPLGEAFVPGRIEFEDLANDAFLRLTIRQGRDDTAAKRDALFDRERAAKDLEQFIQIDRDCDYE